MDLVVEEWSSTDTFSAKPSNLFLGIWNFAVGDDAALDLDKLTGTVDFGELISRSTTF